METIIQTLYESASGFAQSLGYGLSPTRFEHTLARFLGLLTVYFGIGIAATIYRTQLSRFIQLAYKAFQSELQRLKPMFHTFLRSNTPLHNRLLFFILFFSLGIRFYYLSQPIREDEANTFLLYVLKPFYVSLSNYSFANNHILHSFLVKLSSSVFGYSEWALRLPAVFFGSLIPLAGYLVSRRFLHSHAALLCVSFLGGSSYLIEYSSNARGYSLLCLCVIVLMGLCLSLLSAPRLGKWVSFFLISVLGVYTMPLMTLPILLFSLWIGLSFVLKKTYSPLNSLFMTLVCIDLACFVLYTPVFLVTGFENVIQKLRSYPVYNEYASDFFSTASYQLIDFLHLLSSVWLREFSAVPILLLAFFAGLYTSTRLNRHLSHFLVTCLFFFLALFFSGQLYGFLRKWLFFLPIFYFFLSAGIATCLRSKWTHKLLLVEILASIVFIYLIFTGVQKNLVQQSPETGVLPDAKAITAYLSDKIKPDDRLIAPLHAPLQYYFFRSDLPLTVFRQQQQQQQLGITYLVLDHRLTLDHLFYRRYKENAALLLKRFSKASLYQITH